MRVKGAIQRSATELKYIDVASFAATSGSTYVLNEIAEGSDYTERDGRAYNAKSVQIKGFSKPTANGSGSKHRLLIVWDNAPNGAKASVSDILDANSGFPNVSNSKRFTILKRKEWVHGRNDVTATTAVADNGNHDINMYCKLNSPVQCSGTTASITDIQNGAVLLVYQREDGATSSTAAEINVASRFQFTDK